MRRTIETYPQTVNTMKDLLRDALIEAGKYLLTFLVKNKLCSIFLPTPAFRRIFRSSRSSQQTKVAIIHVANSYFYIFYEINIREYSWIFPLSAKICICSLFD